MLGVVARANQAMALRGASSPRRRGAWPRSRYRHQRRRQDSHDERVGVADWRGEAKGIAVLETHAYIPRASTAAAVATSLMPLPNSRVSVALPVKSNTR